MKRCLIVQQNGEQPSAPRNLLPLDVPELSAWIVQGHVPFCHIFGRIRPADWTAYFSPRTEPTSETVDAGALALYHRAILRVEGYVTNTGRKPEQLADWPECIPAEDRVAAVDSLKNIFWAFTSFTVEGDDTVSLEISSNGGQPGPMHRYYSVAHHFRPQMDKDFAGFLARGQDDTGELAFAALISLYDSLIEQADGYSLAGRELHGAQEIVREMDAFHKAIAVGTLFDLDGLQKTKTKALRATLDGVGPKTLAESVSGKVN